MKNLLSFNQQSTIKVQQWLQRLSWLHFQHFHARDQLSQFGRGTCQHRERPEMHWDDSFRLEQFTRIRGLAWRHRVMVANRDHGNLWRVELANDVHVAEDIGVSSVIDL